MKKLLLSGIAGLMMWAGAQRAEAQSSNAPYATFSQYHYTPFITNPAMIGASNDLRLSFNYRRQQIGAGQTFDTPMGSIIYPFFKNNRETRVGGVGINFISDNSASFTKTTGGSAAGAYNIHIGTHSSVSLGGQVGYFQTRLDDKGITTGSQYQNGIFNIEATTNENFSFTSRGFVTFGAGAYWNREDEKDREKAFFGVSYMNINQPSIDFQNGDSKKSRINASLQATGGIRVLHTDRFAIMPTARAIFADAKYQVNVGSWFRYHLSESLHNNMLRDGEFGLGLWYNNNNFMVAALEFNQPHYLLSVSYDIPTTQEKALINSNGILELTGIFKLNRHHQKERPPQTDRDGDGILDINDACPDVPGKREFVGCPDTDEDGIPDDHDNCPQEAGAKVFAGCPDKDNDGIQDSKDQCPDEPGTKETFGCPDKDGDHVPDKSDECPDEAGLAIDKGCPRKIPPATVTEFKAAKIDSSAIRILKAAKYVHFETGTYKIEKVSLSFLDLVIDILKNDYPDKFIRLEGHTDDVGDADKNLTLSVNRADAIKAYMVSQGIKAERIMTTGKGETVPIYPNDSDDNREVNRRVEMTILEKK